MRFCVIKKNTKKKGIYPNSGEIHTLAEFSQDISDIAVNEDGSLRNVYVLVRREREHVANSCREKLCGKSNVRNSDNNTIDLYAQTPNPTGPHAPIHALR